MDAVGLTTKQADCRIALYYIKYVCNVWENFADLIRKISPTVWLTPLLSPWIKTLDLSVSLASTASLNSFAKFGAKKTGSIMSMAFSTSNAFWHSLFQTNFVRLLSIFVNGSAMTENYSVITSHTKTSHQLSCRYRKIWDSFHLSLYMSLTSSRP